MAGQVGWSVDILLLGEGNSFVPKYLFLIRFSASPAENCEDNAEKPLFFGIQTGLEILKKAFAEC